MSPENLNVSSKTHKFLLNKLKDKRTLQIYKKFESELNIVLIRNFVFYTQIFETHTLLFELQIDLH